MDRWVCARCACIRAPCVDRVSGCGLITFFCVSRDQIFVSDQRSRDSRVIVRRRRGGRFDIGMKEFDQTTTNSTYTFEHVVVEQERLKRVAAFADKVYKASKTDTAS